MTTDLKELFSIIDAAELIGIHEKTLFRWLKEGKINATVVGGRRFIAKSEIERIKNERKINEAQELSS